MGIEQEIERVTAVDRLERQYDESTKLSWFWALLFGPIYFAVHGFWGRAAFVLLLNFIIIGFFIAPFLAYPGWKKRARERARDTLLAASLIHSAR